MCGNTARFRFCNTACIRQNQQQPRTRRYLCDGDEPCPHCHPSSLSLPTSYCSQHTHIAHPARTQYCAGWKHALLIRSGLQFLQLLIVVNCKQPYSESLTFFRSSNHPKRVIIVIKLWRFCNDSSKEYLCFLSWGSGWSQTFSNWLVQLLVGRAACWLEDFFGISLPSRADLYLSFQRCFL